MLVTLTVDSVIESQVGSAHWALQAVAVSV